MQLVGGARLLKTHRLADSAVSAGTDFSAAGGSGGFQIGAGDIPWRHSGDIAQDHRWLGNFSRWLVRGTAVRAGAGCNFLTSGADRSGFAELDAVFHVRPAERVVRVFFHQLHDRC